MYFLGNIPALTVLLCLGVSIISPVVEADVLRCAEKVNRGNCPEMLYKYYFNQDTETCRKSIFSGCPMGRNRFDTKEACENTCIKFVDSVTTATAAPTTTTTTTITTTTPPPTTKSTTKATETTQKSNSNHHHHHHSHKFDVFIDLLRK